MSIGLLTRNGSRSQFFMGVTSLLICLWPGLPRLWLQGEGKGLVIATAFAAVLNVSLVTTFVWTGLVDPAISQGLWWLTGLVWVVSTFRGLRMIPRLRTSEMEGTLDEDLFLRAQGEYLSGHWFESESLFQQLLHDTPGDVDARLMLATLYRHTKRLDEAQHQLALLQRQRGSEKWLTEIAHERRFVARLTDEEKQERETAFVIEDGQTLEKVNRAA